MRYVGIVTDPSWLVSFISPERNMRHEVHMKMCPHCGQPYETYRVELYGPAKGMASIAPDHLYLCKYNEEIKIGIMKQFAMPKSMFNSRLKTAGEIQK